MRLKEGLEFMGIHESPFRTRWAPSSVQGGPLAVINGVITPINGLING